MPVSPDAPGGRHRAREFALSALFALEFHGWDRAMEVFDDLAALEEDPLDDHARALVRAVVDGRERLDRALKPCLDRWTIDRLAAVDRTILYIGACEILVFDDVPTPVAINEAVELASRFGGPRSGAFVNGVLDSLGKAEASSSSERMD